MSQHLSSAPEVSKSQWVEIGTCLSAPTDHINTGNLTNHLDTSNLSNTLNIPLKQIRTDRTNWAAELQDSFTAKPAGVEDDHGIIFSAGASEVKSKVKPSIATWMQKLISLNQQGAHESHVWEHVRAHAGSKYRTVLELTSIQQCKANNASTSTEYSPVEHKCHSDDYSSISDWTNHKDVYSSDDNRNNQKRYPRSR